MSLHFSEINFPSTINKNTENDTKNRKRQSSLPKSKIENLEMMQPSTIYSEAEKDDKTQAIYSMINKQSQDAYDAGNSKMGAFQPLANPILMKKTDEKINDVSYSPNIPLPISANSNDNSTYSNYRQIYEKPMTTPLPKPYYANMGITSSSSSSGSDFDKLLEKLNYMTMLLEEQKNEKTNHVGEEFILYTFLGVFIIYIVDSFSRSGKYVR